MHKPQEGVGEYGERVPGPPWILGHRGAPREAPENTLVALRRAIELGLDGVEYDLMACASGEPVLLHDETLDRTTNAHGPVGAITLPELVGVDAGGWFHRRFVGEPVPLLEEALELPGNVHGTYPQHMIELKDPSLVGEVARQLAALPRPLSIRLASFHRRVCVEARDLGLPAMLLGYEATKEDLAFVRDERLAAYGTAPGGWNVPAASEPSDFERWSWSVDEPADLLEACRRPLNGFNTNEPRRALAVRALVALTPGDAGPYPLEVPRLEVETPADAAAAAPHGQWSGRWAVELGVRNPFPFAVEVSVALAVHGGAFEVEGLPVALELEPGARRAFPLRLAGGSWSPGDDPVVHARYRWRLGPGRPREALVLEHPLHRSRTLRLGRESTRLVLLRERPEDPPASMSLWRRGRDLLAKVENPAGLTDLRAIVRLGERVHVGGSGVRAPLPAPFDGGLAGNGDASETRSLPFAVGFEGRPEGAGAARARGPRLLRRWCGGIGAQPRAGTPGRLLLDPRA